MGTSSPNGGPGGRNPLIPDWIDTSGGTPPEGQPPLPPNPDGNPDVPDQDNPNHEEGFPKPDFDNRERRDDHPESEDRYRQPRRQFNKYVRSNGHNTNALKNALRGYSLHAAGNTRTLSVRMRPASNRVSRFYTVINSIKDTGKNNTLAQLNLSGYQSRPLLDILSALSDEIFKNTGKIYEETQDDGITKQAYANTVVRICEIEGIDLDSLTNNQIEVMVAVFIEETIAQRVINDIGTKLTELEKDIPTLLSLEEDIYQIVSGLVRNSIMPEIRATQLGDKRNIEAKIENIYRIAFDAMSTENN